MNVQVCIEDPPFVGIKDVDAPIDEIKKKIHKKEKSIESKILSIELATQIPHFSHPEVAKKLILEGIKQKEVFQFKKVQTSISTQSTTGGANELYLCKFSFIRIFLSPISSIFFLVDDTNCVLELEKVYSVETSSSKFGLNQALVSTLNYLKEDHKDSIQKAINKYAKCKAKNLVKVSLENRIYDIKEIEKIIDK